MRMMEGGGPVDRRMPIPTGRYPCYSAPEMP